MRRLIISAVMALAMLTPAKADTITTGTYQVTEMPDNGYIFFGFTGGFTDLGPINPPDQTGFVYSWDAVAAVDGNGFFDNYNLGCPMIVEPGCSHHGAHPTNFAMPVYLGENIEISVRIQSNWTNDVALSYNGGILTAVPEPSSWALMLIGFAGVGLVTYRRRRYATPCIA